MHVCVPDTGLPLSQALGRVAGTASSPMALARDWGTNGVSQQQRPRPSASCPGCQCPDCRALRLEAGELLARLRALLHLEAARPALRLCAEAPPSAQELSALVAATHGPPSSL